MKKEEYIKRFGTEAYEAFKERQREYAKSHPQKGDRHRKGYYRERYRKMKKKSEKSDEIQGKLTKGYNI